MKEYLEKVFVKDEEPELKELMKDNRHNTDYGMLEFTKDSKWTANINFVIEVKPTWWLKPVEGILLTPDELNEERRLAAISFLESIRDYERENGRSITYDERTSEELYKEWLSIKEKEEKE